MTSLIYVLNGPNLNMLGVREPEVYGTETLDDLRARTEKAAAKNGLSIDFRQSNIEGEIVSWVQEARGKAKGIIINAGGYTHTRPSPFSMLCRPSAFPSSRFISRTSSGATSFASIPTFRLPRRA